MHDIRAIREDRDGFVRALSRRGVDAAAIADDLLEKDKALRELLTRLQVQQARRNDAWAILVGTRPPGLVGTRFISRSVP